MVGIMANSGHTQYGLKDFVVDTVKDLENLPLDVPMGSVALVIATSGVYMLNSNKEWIEI